MVKAIYFYITGLCALLLTGCNHDELAVVNDGENPIKAGEQILFTSMLPDEAGATRSKKSEWEEEVKKYSPVNHDYTFSVTMWKKDAATESGTSTYKPLQTTDVGSSDISGYDGTLKVADGATPLYWPDNVSEWGFTAEANTSTLLSDQSTQEKWLAMDYLKGHSYLPVWTGDEESGSGTDPETPMYLTSKEWYKKNQQVKDLEGLMVNSQEDYKKIPLYMQHQRAWITVILRAGEGVTREALAFEKAAENIRMAINSYTKNGSEYTKQEIGQPWASEYFIDYGKDVNGDTATHVSTTRYDAIVEPHKYGERKDEDVIAKINLSNQNFSFYASNDTRFVNGTDAEKQAAEAAYNLEAGKHLTIEVTLSRESRKILITAWIEDWTEVVTSTICDDYGQNGDPVVIQNRAELIAFLTDPMKNCQGSVGIIQPSELPLDVEGEPWPGTYDLNATLNLAGCKLVTGHRIFKSMTSSANLVNGTVSITDGAALDCAIALKNEGTIERVQVVTSGENSTAKATLAGMVGLNTGTIYQCSSTLPVYATFATGIEGTTLRGYVGGIAAVSEAVDNTSMAVIDGCTVNASVNGTCDIKGGGIVGYATGRISNNLFEYGITVMQNATNFKNIFGKAGNIDLRAYNNRWPTKAINPINESSGTTNPNNYSGTTFDAVIDCEDELDYVIKELTLNVKDKNYRISKSFTVESDNWKHGNVIDDPNSTEKILFNLDGNDKTITLTGNKKVTVWSGAKPEDGTSTTYTTAPMLFNYVMGEIKDLTLYLEKPIVAVPSVSKAGEYNATDAIAPLAYAVYGTDAKLSNIKVKAHKTDGSIDVYVQAATPAGLVVWAFGGATVTQCKVQVPVQMWLPSNVGAQGRHYAGGIVACAAKASIRESVYLVQSNNALGSAYHAMGANHYYGGIVGGTSIKDTETPSLQIADCTSWFAPVSGETGVRSRGSVIGFACYTRTDQGSALANGMDPNKKSEGNWWPLNTVGAYTRADGYTEEMVIGKRNAVSPTHEDL